MYTVVLTKPINLAKSATHYYNLKPKAQMSQRKCEMLHIMHKRCYVLKPTERSQFSSPEVFVRLASR